MKCSLATTLIALVLAALTQAAMAADNRVTLTTGVDYSTGKYGGTQSTDITFIPVIAKYETGLWTWKLSVPYIRITGPGNVVPSVGQVASGSGSRTTQSGLGDVVASASYTVYSSLATQTLIDLTGKVKFATADETKNLGTGKNDYAAQVDIYKLVGKFTPFGTVGYKVLGSPATYTLNNVWYGTLGAAYKVSKTTTSGLMFDLRQKSSPAGAPRRELTAFVSHKLSHDWRLQGYAVKGFADGSPDWGIGAMVSYSY